MKLASYWLDTAPAFGGGRAGPPEGRADVAVVGGGFTGLTAALALAEKGARVVLLEAGRVGAEASGRNGGQCNNGLAVDFGGLAATLGLDRARALYHAYDAAVDSVEALATRTGIECGFRRVGKLKLAAKPAHYDKMARGFELLAREAEPRAELLSASDLKGEIASDGFYGAVLHPRSAALHPGKLAAGLAEAAARQGVALHENTPLTRLERLSGQRHRLHCGKTSFEADQVLLATGATPPVAFFRRRIMPIGSFIITTQPLGAAAETLLPKRRNCTTSRVIGTYFRLTDDNRLLFGGRARFALSTTRSDPESGRILQATLARTFPQLAGTAIDYCWGGQVDMTQDRLPRAGQQDGLFYAMGYSGHGTQMSVHMGGIMAEVMNGREDLNPWRGFDWPAVPGHFGKPWFLPAVGAYYRLLDHWQ